MFDPRSVDLGIVKVQILTKLDQSLQSQIVFVAQQERHLYSDKFNLLVGMQMAEHSPWLIDLCLKSMKCQAQDCEIVIPCSWLQGRNSPTGRDVGAGCWINRTFYDITHIIDMALQKALWSIILTPSQCQWCTDVVSETLCLILKGYYATQP